MAIYYDPNSGKTVSSGTTVDHGAAAAHEAAEAARRAIASTYGANGTNSTNSTNSNTGSAAGKYVDMNGNIVSSANGRVFDASGWSAADLALPAEARQLIAQYKAGWQDATTAGDKAFYNAKANEVRAQYGSYLGGGDGLDYAPLSQPEGYVTTTDTYKDPYLDDTLKNLEAAEKAEFFYNPNTDDMYQYYVDALTRQGQSAAEAAIANYASATGGIPSSVAAAAAAQAQQAYAKQAADMIPTLEAAAYDRYLGQLQNYYDQVNHYMNLSDTDYSRWYDDLMYRYALTQDEEERKNADTAYGQWLAELEEQQRQFDQSLAEDQRQFDQSLAEELRQFDQSLAEELRQFDQSLAYDYAALDQDQSQYDQSLAYDYSVLEAENGSSSSSSSSGGGNNHNSKSNSEDNALKVEMAMGVAPTNAERLALAVQAVKNGTINLSQCIEIGKRFGIDIQNAMK